MVTKLSNLRLAAELDADGFTAGATAIEQSSSRAGAAVKGLGESIQQTDVKVGRSGDGIRALSMRYVDGFANQVKYEQGLRRINAALEKGAIDQAQAQQLIAGMTAKLAFAGDAAQLAASGQTQLAGIVSAVNRDLQVETGHIDRNTAALLRNAAASKAARAANDNVRVFNTANIAAQFQDIGVTAAMGMSPLQIALQQGTQLSAIFEQMKASGQGVGTALAAAITSVISPLSLLTIGAVAAGAAIIRWFMKSEDSADKLEKKLEAHAAAVRMIKDLYGETAAAAERAGNAGGLAFSAASIRSDAAFWQRELQRQAQQVTDKMRGDGILTRGLFGSLANVKDLRAAAGDLTDEVEALIRSAGNGSADFDTFNHSLDAAFETVRRSGKDVTAAYNEIERVREVAQAAFQVGGKFQEFAGPINQLQVGIASNNVDLEKFNSWVEQIGKQKGIQSQADQAIALGAELVKIAGYLQQIENARFLKTEQIRDRLASERMDTGQSYFQQRQREWELEDRILDAQTQQVKALTDQEKIAAAGALAKARNPVEGEQRRREVLIAERQERERLDAAWRQGEIQRARARDEDILQAQQEFELIGKTVGQVAALEFQWQAEGAARQAAAEAGRKIGDDELRAIGEQAAAVGALAQKYAELQLVRGLQFDREQLGRTDTEQKVAAAMRSLWGDDYQSHMNDATAGLIRFNIELEKTGEIGKDVFDSFIDALTSSGDLVENLISAFAQLGKMFATLGAEKLYDYISGKSSSLFGGSTPSVGGSASVANYRASGQAIGETIAPPIVDSLNSNLDTFAAAIRKIESGSYAGNYNAVGPVVTSGMYAGDRAYGAYQIMGGNIAPWTKEVLGTSLSIKEFLGNQAAQDKVAYAKMGAAFDKFGNWSDTASVWFSGGPLAANSNRSDGYTSVPSYVSQTQAAMDNYPGGLAKAVSDGTVDASKRIRVGNNFQDTYDVAPGSVASQGGMTKMQGLLGVGGAALGAFAGGFQSGDPISGAIGGAMAGLGAAPALAAMGIAGPVGIIGGAIIGLVGGLIGKAKQKKQEMKQAQQELESQMGAITQLIATATGNFMGSFEKSFTSTTDEFQKAIALAEKAGNKVMVEKLKSSMDEFFGTLQDQWDRGFEGVLASMNAGLGFDGEFVKGSDAVEKMRESLVGFVNDAKFFAEANGDLSSMLDARKNEFGIGTTQQTLYRYQPQYREAGSEGSWVDNELTAGYLDIANQMVDLGVAAFTRAGGQLYPTLEALKRAATDAGLAIDEQGKVTRELKAANDNLAGSVERAREGAQATALAMLSGGKEFTEVEKAIQRLEGAAATLPSLLEDLGMSAEEAAKAIEHHLNIALRDLRNNLTTDLTRSINDLAGFGYLNDLLDAQTAYETHLQELEALGMDTGLAMQELGLRLANIAKEAELTDDQLTQLAAVFPQLGGSLLGLIGAGGTGTAAAVADAKAKLDDAKADLRRAYEEEASRLNQVISKHEAYIKSLQKFKDDLKLDSNLSPYDPYQRLQEAQRQFQETATAALGGDEDALGRIEDVSRSYLEEARSYYGTSEAYFSIFNDVQSLLDQALAVSNSSLSEAQQQLAALKDLVSPLIDINDSVMSVADAIAALTAAEAANAAAIAARDAQQAQLFQQMLGLLQQTGQAYDPFVSSLYRDVLGRAPDAEGAAYYTNMLNSGMSQDAVRAQFIANAQPELARGYPLFAEGGFHAGGYRIVGERGPELEATGPSRIWSASDTSRILSQAWQAQSYGASNDNGNGELLREVKALREQNAKLLERLISVSATGAQATTAAARETSLAVREQTKAARLERRQKVA